MYKKLLFKLLEASEALDLNAAGVQITTEGNIPSHLLKVPAKCSHVFNSSPIYSTLSESHTLVQALKPKKQLSVKNKIYVYVVSRSRTGATRCCSVR